MMGEWFGLASEEPTGNADVVVFGVPFDAAVFFRRGAAQAPATIRSLSSRLPPATEDGRDLSSLQVIDLGDIRPESNGDDLDVLHARLRQTFFDAREKGLPLAIGGDHSISIPLLQAAGEWAGRDVGIVWVDAHPDLCDRYDGSPFSHACVMRRALETPFVQPQNVFMVGIRSCEVEEIKFLRSRPVTVVTAAEAAGRSGGEVGEELVHRLSRLPVYLSLDIDAFDPAFAPGTGIPDAGGLSTRWVLDLVHSFAALSILGVDIVEVAPPLDVPSGATSLLALKLVLEILGLRLL
jgi:agmatinase